MDLFGFRDGSLKEAPSNGKRDLVRELVDVLSRANGDIVTKRRHGPMDLRPADREVEKPYRWGDRHYSDVPDDPVAQAKARYVRETDFTLPPDQRRSWKGVERELFADGLRVHGTTGISPNVLRRFKGD
jgi:hypothetical protein